MVLYEGGGGYEQKKIEEIVDKQECLSTLCRAVL